MKEVVSRAKRLRSVDVATLFPNDYYVEVANFSVYQK